MKTFWAVLLLAAWSAVAIPPSGVVTFAWDYPTTNVTFRLYSTTNLAAPVWKVVTNTTARQVTVRIDKVASWFAVTAIDATNFWAESDFSNVLPVTDPPRPGQNLSVVRGQ